MCYKNLAITTAKSANNEARGGVESRRPVAPVPVPASTASDLLAAVQFENHRAAAPYRGRIIL